MCSASCPVVGSSSTSTPGAPTSSDASASRWRPPWLSSQGLATSSPLKPKNSTAPEHVEDRILRPGPEPEAELQLADHGRLEQHLVGGLEQQRHLRGVLENLAGTDRLAAEPDHAAS